MNSDQLAAQRERQRQQQLASQMKAYGGSSGMLGGAAEQFSNQGMFSGSSSDRREAQRRQASQRQAQVVSQSQMGEDLATIKAMQDGPEKYLAMQKFASTYHPKNEEHGRSSAQDKPIKDALSYVNQQNNLYGEAISKSIIDQSPAWKAAVDEYNKTGKTSNPMFQDKINQMVNYSDGRITPGNLNYVDGRNIELQHRKDNEQGGFDKFMTNVVAPAILAVVGGGVASGLSAGAGAGAASAGTAEGGGLTASQAASTAALSPEATAAGTAMGTGGTASAAGVAAGSAGGTAALPAGGMTATGSMSTQTSGMMGAGNAGTTAGSGVVGGGSAGGGGLLSNMGQWVSNNPALVGAGLRTIGGLVIGNQAQHAASTSADQQRAAAQAAAEAARFHPVGITNRFGQSNFQYDANGKLIGAGYTLTPEMKAQQDALMGVSGQALSQYQNAINATGGMGAGAQRMMELGNQYLATSPQEQAAKYYADQQALLAGNRASDYAALQNKLQAQGRGGLSIGGGGGMMASNPEMQAYYNSLRQQDLGLAAQATQGGQQYAQFGAGMLGAGGSTLRDMYGTQQAAYNPYATALGGVQNIEGLGQQTLQIGAGLGQQAASAGSNAGQFLLTGGTNAANTQQPGNAYSPWGALLGGVGNYFSNQSNQSNNVY